MSKKTIDITEKLSFDENPRIKVKDAEFEVNSDAETMLKIMGILGENENAGPKEIVKMYELLFSEADRRKIGKLKLSFSDFQIFVHAAINVITGDSDQGE